MNRSLTTSSGPAAIRRWVLGMVLIAAGAIPVGCDRPKTGQAPPAPPEKTEWSAAEIAKDPQGYLLWSDRQIEKQIADREARLRTVSERRTQLEQKRQLLAQNIADVENVRKRLADAYQNAEDEDRWPVRMAGRTFERTKAQAILEETKRYVEERRPLETAYDQSLGKMDQMASSLRSDIQNLTRLREKLALDLEQVRLNQSTAELEKWRKTETELASMGRMLSSMSDDPSSIPTPREPPGRVNIDEMLK